MAGNIDKIRPAYTDVHMKNNTDIFVGLGDTKDIKDWYGSGVRPTEIQSKRPEHFYHNADTKSDGGSVGGNAYLYNNKVFKWIFAWSTTGDKNTVYTDIQKADYTVIWDDVLDALQHTCTEKATPISVDFGFTSTVTIDAKSATPELMATLDPN